jgi:isocitrate/isopropylmalate dehydrogenase
MLIWLGEEEAAKRLMESVETVTERGIRTRDLGGSAGTKEVTDAVCAELEILYGSSPK